MRSVASIRLGLWLCLCAMGVTATAAAQKYPDDEYSLSRFTPAIGAGNYLTLSGANIPGDKVLSLGLTLDFFLAAEPVPPWTFETFPRTAGPVSFYETYWVELEVRRRDPGRSSISCRMWADGLPRPESALSAELDVEGPAAWLGLRTYRTAATFDSIQVTPLVEP